MKVKAMAGFGLAIFVFVALFSGIAFAGYDYDFKYGYSGSYTTSGGGTWGSILKMTGSINNSTKTVSVKIEKQSGCFSSSGYIYEQGYSYGESSSYNLASTSVYSGNCSRTLASQNSLDNISSWMWSNDELKIYGRYEDSGDRKSVV